MTGLCIQPWNILPVLNQKATVLIKMVVWVHASHDWHTWHLIQSWEEEKRHKKANKQKGNPLASKIKNKKGEKRGEMDHLIEQFLRVISSAHGPSPGGFPFYPTNLIGLCFWFQRWLSSFRWTHTHTHIITTKLNISNNHSKLTKQTWNNRPSKLTKQTWSNRPLKLSKRTWNNRPSKQTKQT